MPHAESHRPDNPGEAVKTLIDALRAPFPVVFNANGQRSNVPLSEFLYLAQQQYMVREGSENRMADHMLAMLDGNPPPQSPHTPEEKTAIKKIEDDLRWFSGWAQNFDTPRRPTQGEMLRIKLFYLQLRAWQEEAQATLSNRRDGLTKKRDALKEQSEAMGEDRPAWAATSASKHLQFSRGLTRIIEALDGVFRACDIPPPTRGDHGRTS